MSDKCRIFESTEQHLTAADVDVEDGVIHNVKLCGLESKNKGRVLGVSRKKYGEALDRPYAYPHEELDKTDYVGLPVYLNHAPRPEKGKTAAPRSEDDQIGFVETQFMKPDGKYGSVRLFIKDPRAPKQLERAQKAPHLVGFSHTASGTPVKRGDRIAIEGLAPKTVDLVTDPATTAGLFESEAEEMTITELLEAEPEHKLADVVRLLIAEGLIEGCDGAEGDDNDKKFKKAVKKSLKDEDDEEDEDGDKMPKKMKEEVIQLTERVAELEITAELQEAGVMSPELWQINAVMSAESVEDKTKLIESFQPSPFRAAKPRPKSSPPKTSNTSGVVKAFESRVEKARDRNRAQLRESRQ